MKFFLQVQIWFQAMMQLLSGQLERFVDPAIKIVNVIKLVVDDPALDFITQLTAQKWDELVLEKVRAALTEALQILQISKTCLEKETDEEMIKCLITGLRSRSPQMRAAIYSKLASLIARNLSENELRTHEADTLVNLRYAQGK